MDQFGVFDSLTQGVAGVIFVRGGEVVMDRKNEQLHTDEEDEQVACSNQLLAAIRERMAKKREAGRNSNAKVKMPEPEPN